jgi:hypothetical protein
MIMATKNDIFATHKAAYYKANKQEKGVILDAVCKVTNMQRKAAIRKFKRLQRRDPFHIDRRGRTLYYTPDATAALKTIWEAGNEVCGELLYPMIDEYVSVLKRDSMWHHSDSATKKLLEMSEATVKRRARKFLKARRTRKGISATKPSHIKHLVPIFIGPWSEKPPGFGQVDTVMHSNSASGDAVFTVNYTDAATLTVVPRAQWNKGQEATAKSMQEIKARLPFAWLGAHPDTGSEFINRFVMQWCNNEHVELSRSRPNHKNDNMYVEERNGHIIRKTVGYITLNCPEAADALNDLYDVLTPYHIHFIAVRRMTGKERLGARYRRTYEPKAKTPYQRILEHISASEGTKQKLRREHAKLNPLILKKEIEKRLKNLYDIQHRYGNPPQDN